MMGGIMKSIIVEKDPKSPVAEAYRTLRTNIQFSSLDKEVKTIVVTSSGATEGKSTTAVNLAVSFIQMGKKVVVVDGDLRKPKMAKIFNISNHEGLTTVFFEQEPISKFIKKEGNVDILTSGPTPPNPSELLGSDRMKKVLEDLRELYDYVIIDSPPVGYVTDGAILASICDGTIFVIAAGESDQRAVKHAKEQLDKVSANILGAVLTKIPIKGKGYYKYHYSNYYGNK